MKIQNVKLKSRYHFTTLSFTKTACEKEEYSEVTLSSKNAT